MIITQDMAAQVVEKMIPLHKWMNVKLLEMDPERGFCKLLFPYREEVIGNFWEKRWHGGIIAAALDSVGGGVAMMTLTSVEDKVATIDMRVDYLRGTSPTDLVVTAELVRSGNRIIATKMQAWQENEQKLVAEGRGMYSVYRKNEIRKGES